MSNPPARRVLLLGATGTIGQACAQALVARGYEVVCFVRNRADIEKLLPDVALRFGDVTDPVSLREEGFKGETFGAVVSCLASRTGAPKDAWAIDHQANLNALEAAKVAGVDHFVLLSAICVQKPLLAFQRAKLAFEKALISSGLTYSIVRPTAFFKSLSGQLERVKAGKPFLVFGDGKLTACKPISDADLANYLVDCLDSDAHHNALLPIGGPGPAFTPLEQGTALFEALGKEPKFKHVPVALISTIIAVLSGLGKIVPNLAEKAELARIGHYYATQSMLVWNAEINRYDSQATPSYGNQTLPQFYRQLARGEVVVERGDHTVF